MTKINISSPGGGGSVSDGVLQISGGNPIDATLQTVEDQSANTSALQLSDDKVKATSAEQCPLEVESTGVGGGIALLDTNTTDNQAVGVGALGDLLCLRGGSSSVGTMQVAGGYIDLLSNELRNFIPRIETQGANITISNTNDTQYNGAVMELTGAFTITIANTVVDGFSLSVIQMDANQGTFAASGGSLTLRNRLGHTQTAGQWATITLYKNGNNLILAGDTA